MAILSFRLNHLTERSGDAARRVVQYFTRTGEYKPEEVAYMLRTSEDTRERGDFVDKQTGNLPAWAEGDPGTFFAQAEQQERSGVQRGGRWATTWQIALPRELTRAEQWAMGTAFIATHLANHAYLVVMHDPVKDGEHQPHLHVLFSERVDDGRDHPASVYFRRPEVGGCPKDRWFHQRSSIDALRTSWADWANYTLERAGHAARLHPRSLRARDIDRKPEPKVGWSTDPVTLAGRAAIQAQRDVAKEHALASAGWEARKAMLGMTDVRQIDPQGFLQESYARTRGREPARWAPHTLSPQAQLDVKRWRYAQAVERRGAERTQARTRLTTEVRLLEHHLTRLALPPRQEEHTRGGGLRVRLTEERAREGERYGR